MRSFDHPFDFYHVERDRPMAVEQHPQGVRRYLHLNKNPIYYYNAFQFVGGSLFRSIFGYEKLWDLDFEAKLIRVLDASYEKLKAESYYYFEEIIFQWRTSLLGVKWRRGVCPKHFFLKRSHKQVERIFVERGIKATARINKTVFPHQVDIDCEGGPTFTIGFQDYEKLKRWFIRRRDEKPFKRQISTDEKNGECGEASKAKSTSRENSVKKMDVKLPGLRKRQRWPYTLRQARSQIR